MIREILNRANRQQTTDNEFRAFGIDAPEQEEYMDSLRVLLAGGVGPVQIREWAISWASAPLAEALGAAAIDDLIRLLREDRNIESDFVNMPKAAATALVDRIDAQADELDAHNRAIRSCHASLVDQATTSKRVRALVSDFQANGNSAELGDPREAVWHKAAAQLLRALDGGQK